MTSPGPTATPSPLLTMGKAGELGAWEITILPKGSQQMEKKVVTASGLLPIIQKYPDTMEVHFLGQGECLLECPGEQ